MRKRLFRVSIAAAIACVVLAPALIWSGQRPQSANGAADGDLGLYKEPPVFTMGPPMTAEELAAREHEKRLSIPEARARAFEYTVGAEGLPAAWRDVPREAISPPATRHPGLTPAEIEKLAAIRSGALQPRDGQDRGKRWPKPDLKAERVDAPLRPLGPEGLTDEEKAKLEASRVREEQAGGNEGGRSR